MSTAPESNGTGGDHAPCANQKGRQRPARFILVFVALVLLQLTAYRYGVDSGANDRYLFCVARHTAWALGCIGHRASLEAGGARINPAEARAFIADNGAVVHGGPSPEMDAPLSAWERWQYRARRIRQSSAPSGEIGPQVSFILRPGIHHQIQELEEKRGALEKAGPTPERDEVDHRLAALRQTLSESLQDPELRKALQGRHFTFNVVPTCGAIEIMAIFIAAILAFPAGWRARGKGMLFGLPLLYLLNIFRLTCLAVIGALDNGGPWFTFIHEYVWQAIYVIFVVVIWLAWVEFTVRRRAR